MPIDINSKPYWQNYVDSCLVLAGDAYHLNENDNEGASNIRNAVQEPFRCLNSYYYDHSYPRQASGARSLLDMSSVAINIGNSTVVQQGSAAPQTQEEQDQQAARRATIIGGIAGAIAAFATGYFFTQFNESRKAVNLTDEIREALKDEILHPQAGLNRDIFREIFALNEARSKINQRVYEKNRNNLIAAATVLGGAVTAVAGGLMVATAVITAGYVALFAGAFFFLLNAGMHWNDSDQDKVDHRAILGYTLVRRGQEEEGDRTIVEGLADKVRGLLNNYNDRMGPNGPGAYQPVQEQQFPRPYANVYPVLPQMHFVSDNEYTMQRNSYSWNAWAAQNNVAPSAPSFEEVNA